jgi:hypothetical protein
MLIGTEYFIRGLYCRCRYQAHDGSPDLLSLEKDFINSGVLHINHMANLSIYYEQICTAVRKAVIA